MQLKQGMIPIYTQVYGHVEDDEEVPEEEEDFLEKNN